MTDEENLQPSDRLSFITDSHSSRLEQLRRKPDYYIRFFDTDYQIPDVDLTKCGLQDTWKIEKIPAITLHGEISIFTRVPAQECWREYRRMNTGEGEWVITNR